MVGAIGRRDILAHPFVTVRCFGWRVFFRALLANHNQTFLSLLAETGALDPPPAEAPDLVDRSIKLELRAKQIYEWLADRFLGYRSVCRFFESLARQEETHAELLRLCREAARSSGWKDACLSPWREAVPRLEQRMAEVEASLHSIDGVSKALRLVIEIEGSEVNQVFEGVIQASGSEFIRSVRPFQIAVAEHLSYIRERISEIRPDLAELCKELAEKQLAGAG